VTSLGLIFLGRFWGVQCLFSSRGRSAHPPADSGDRIFLCSRRSLLRSRAHQYVFPFFMAMPFLRLLRIVAIVSSISLETRFSPSGPGFFLEDAPSHNNPSFPSEIALSKLFFFSLHFAIYEEKPFHRLNGASSVPHLTQMGRYLPDK